MCAPVARVVIICNLPYLRPCVIRMIMKSVFLPGLIVCLHALVEHNFRLCSNRTSLYFCSSSSCQLCQTWECWQFLVSSTVPHPVLLTSFSILVWSVWEGSEVISCHSSLLRLWAVRLKACQLNSYAISECVIEVCLSLCYHRDPVLQSTESYSVHNMAFELCRICRGPPLCPAPPGSSEELKSGTLNIVYSVVNSRLESTGSDMLLF